MMNPTDRNSSVASSDFPAPLALGRVERVLTHLAALIHARNLRRTAQADSRRQGPARVSRSEAFRQVQHEKWLGKPPLATPGVAAAASARPKDLHRRVLQDPHV